MKKWLNIILVIIIVIVTALAILCVVRRNRGGFRDGKTSADASGASPPCAKALAVFQEENQAFCANTWCPPGKGKKTRCDCPVFNNYGLAPYGSFMKYKDDPDVVVSTYDIVQGAHQPAPNMCFGKYINCYGQPCYAHPDNQKLVQCHCKVEEGPFLTASSSCGPDANGNLPNGAAIAEHGSGLASANSIIQIAQAIKRGN